VPTPQQPKTSSTNTNPSPGPRARSAAGTATLRHRAKCCKEHGHESARALTPIALRQSHPRPPPARVRAPHHHHLEAQSRFSSVGGSGRLGHAYPPAEATSGPESASSADVLAATIYRAQARALEPLRTGLAEAELDYPRRPHVPERLRAFRTRPRGHGQGAGPPLAQPEHDRLWLAPWPASLARSGLTMPWNLPPTWRCPVNARSDYAICRASRTMARRWSRGELQHRSGGGPLVRKPANQPGLGRLKPLLTVRDSSLQGLTIRHPCLGSQQPGGDRRRLHSPPNGQPGLVPPPPPRRE